MFTLTKNHREIWSQVAEKPELARVLDLAPDLHQDPITDIEWIFVLFLILHLASSFEATKQGMLFTEVGLRADMKKFFARPIPAHVWAEVEKYQPADFVKFVNSSL